MRVSLIVAVVTAVVIAPRASVLGESFSWKKYAGRSDEWFRGEEGRRTTENILSRQSPLGSWPKNLDTAKEPYRGDPAKLDGTFDNNATFGELRYLALAYRAAPSDRIRDAFLKGLDLTLSAQYPNGGFPQHFPTSKTGYDRHITFNDGTMVNALRFLRDVALSDDFSFIDRDRRAAARRGFDRGIACILACQVKVEGKLTVWCAQHDRETLEPRPARTFELVSLSGGESAGILQLLMDLDPPSAEVARAIEAGVRWFDDVKLQGIRVARRAGDTVVVRDPGAPPLWARFYEIDTNRPFFCGRDGIKKYELAAIEHERRNGYAWYGNWGRDVARRYAEWKHARAR